MHLTDPQRRALQHIRDRAIADRDRALSRLAAVWPGGDPAAPLAGLPRHARITLNFHPDRIASHGRTVAEGLLESGLYQSQFLTGISNGSRTAFPGGERDDWEATLFGRAYHEGGEEDRPKYGAFNLLGHQDGAAPRFGSCHVVLKPEVLARSTFCFSDSHLGPADVGTIDAFESVLAALLEEAARTRRVLGVDGMDVSTLTRVLLEGPALAALPARALDEYIEAQVHGPVALARDVEALVIDPSFDGTSTGAVLAAIANRHGLPLRRHAGFALPVDQVPEAFRGPAIPPLARRVD